MFERLTPTPRPHLVQFSNPKNRRILAVSLGYATFGLITLGILGYFLFS